MTDTEKFEQWAIVDVMGHQRFVGLVTEQVIAGQGFVRVDIPKTSKQPGWSKLIGTASIYAITPVEKDIAVSMAENLHKKPIEAYQLTDAMVRESHQLTLGHDEYEEDFDDINR